jgi:hypothetical protein
MIRITGQQKKPKLYKFLQNLDALDKNIPQPHPQNLGMYVKNILQHFSQNLGGSQTIQTK